MDTVIDALATVRLTRLVTADHLTDPWRVEMQERLKDGGHRRAAYFLGCPWCTSPYIAVGVVLARRLVPRAWAPVALVLAYSAVAGIAAEHS